MDSRTTFARLVAQHERVQIPIIQRDYAQGRTDQKEVRSDFLRALHAALSLPADDPLLPLDLDFVYGSVSGGAFQPLDGQQRLTTLFLLHWYLAWTDGKLAEFREIFVEDSKSRFGYQVRPSSKDFVDELAQFDPGPFAAECDLVGLITDQPWYVRSWQYDQTIRSSLEMFRAMQEVFVRPSGLYDRLVDESQPAISFQLLDLQSFELSDELYIKMNARGKPLTPFETFKARFEQHLTSNFADLQLRVCENKPVGKFFAGRMDGKWSDFFWPYKDRTTATFDSAIMNVLRVVIMVTRDPENIEGTNADLSDLRGLFQSTFTTFKEKNWLDRSLVVALLSLLESWSTQRGDLSEHLPNDCPYDLVAAFRQIITDPSRLTFQDLALFGGYVQFVAAAEGQLDKTALGDWMRVVFNLAVNTDYNRPDDLRRSLAGIAAIRSKMATINAFLVEPDADIRGFSLPQVAEEKLKAQLIRLDDEWLERIRRAEQHDYLKGQIGFLLRFSGLDLGVADGSGTPVDSDSERLARPKFDQYFSCAKQMLTDLRAEGDEGRTWELALLAVGDVLLPAGRNCALPGLKDGPGSWKRLLRLAAAGESQGKVLQELWDRLDDPENAQVALKHIIDSEPDVDAWRKALIETPMIYEYCAERMIRFNEQGTYPLKRTQMNGAHVELFTYALFSELKVTGALKAFRLEYHETSSADEPHLGLYVEINGTEFDFQVMSMQDEEEELYYVWLEDPRSPEPAVSEILADQKYLDDGGFLTKTVEQEQLRAAMLDLDRALAQVKAHRGG